MTSSSGLWGELQSSGSLFSQFCSVLTSMLRYVPEIHFTNGQNNVCISSCTTNIHIQCRLQVKQAKHGQERSHVQQILDKKKDLFQECSVARGNPKFEVREIFTASRSRGSNVRRERVAHGKTQRIVVRNEVKGHGVTTLGARSAPGVELAGIIGDCLGEGSSVSRSCLAIAAHRVRAAVLPNVAAEIFGASFQSRNHDKTPVNGRPSAICQPVLLLFTILHNSPGDPSVRTNCAVARA